MPLTPDALLGLCRYQKGRWRGWIDPKWLAMLGDEDPLAWLARHPGKAVPRRPVSRTRHIETEHGPIYAKHTNAPGIGAPEAPITAPPWQYPKWWIASPAVHVAHITANMHAQGMPTTPVLLAARRRRGLKCDDLLITEAVPGATLRRRFRRFDTPQAQDQALAEAARVTASFHAAGFIHGDLLPGNILFARKTQQYILIDHDRTRLHGNASWRARRRNLEQMVFRLLRMAPAKQSRGFLLAYFAALDANPDDAATREKLAEVLRAARRRFTARRLDRVRCHIKFARRSERRREKRAARKARRQRRMVAEHRDQATP